MSLAPFPENSVKTVVVVPCYNEAQRIDVGRFRAFLAKTSDIDFLLVDDGSTDQTRSLLTSLAQDSGGRVTVCGLDKNVGKAEAVRQGVQKALVRSPNFVGYWDADLATPLEAIDQFRSVFLEHQEIQLVLGSRVPLLGRSIHRRTTRQLLGRSFAIAASLVLRLPVYDTQCGAKLFRVTPATSGLFAEPFHSRWIFDVEILARLSCATGWRVEEMQSPLFEYPLDRWDEIAGSKLRLRDFLAAVIELAGVFWRYTLRRKQPSTLAIPQFSKKTSTQPHRAA
ncbi:MAG: glycosyltransferase [Pirellulales bacterium]|nr:glycosyltransferase [Pirellulales bacterium]